MYATITARVRRAPAGNRSRAIAYAPNRPSSVVTIAAVVDTRAVAQPVLEIGDPHELVERDGRRRRRQDMGSGQQIGRL